MKLVLWNILRNLCRLGDGVMDDKIIILATNQLMNDENRELILPIRKKIWLEYGPIEQNGKNALLTEGLLKRLSLAKICINKVFYLCEKEPVLRKNLKMLLKSIEEYIDGMIPAQKLESVKNEKYSIFEELAYTEGYEKLSLIGLACVYAANIALWDDLLLQDTSESDMDEDLDSFSWDTSYMISLIYSMDFDHEYNRAKREEFWMWYLSVAKNI